MYDSTHKYILDFDKKGNIVRFFLGDKEDDYWGDDWDDMPYEYNAGEVYDRYVKDHVDIVFPFDALVLEPRDGNWDGNSDYCKEDMKNRRVPCIIVVPISMLNGDDFLWRDNFKYWMGSDKVRKIYFEDNIYDVFSSAQKIMEGLYYVNE